MKRWLWFPALLAAAWFLSRLPHPAVDVGKLEPVSVVLVDFRDGVYHLQTDTGDHGTGQTLTRAAQDLTETAPGRVFLETAEYLLLTPDTPMTRELYQVFHPSCRVCLAPADTDLKAAGEYLSAHRPEQTLTKLRAGEGTPEQLTMEGDSRESP